MVGGRTPSDRIDLAKDPATFEKRNPYEGLWLPTVTRYSQDFAERFYSSESLWHCPPLRSATETLLKLRVDTALAIA